MAHWASRDKASQWAVFFGEQIGAASGTPVRVSLGVGPDQAGHVLYPAADAGGEPMMAAILLAIVITTLGLALVPLLMVEEKEAHTLDTLLVSPASLGQLITAKAITGFVYCLVCGRGADRLQVALVRLALCGAAGRPARHGLRGRTWPAAGRPVSTIRTR